MYIVILFLVLIILIYYSIKEPFSVEKGGGTCILLTTTVYINTKDYLNNFNSPEARLKIYKDCIDKWLANTDLIIYVVESSNYDFPEYKNNPRVKVYTFISTNQIDCKHCSATPYEAESILRAFNYFGLNTYDKIIKVTGKYYIPNIEQIIEDIPPDAELYFQNLHEYDRKVQNSEIFGCQTKLLPTLMNLIIKNSRLNMNFENTLYSIKDKYIVYRLPPIKLETPIRRSGDNKIMDYL